MKHPYESQPPRAFWHRSISRLSSADIDPVSSASFIIESQTKVATAGSCFAQHMARHLRTIGIEPLVTEQPHAEVLALGADFHYGVYTARYGNIYSSRQLLQLMERAYGHLTPEEGPWLGRKGEWIDPFRPLIPGGFATLREYERDRERHFDAVREMFESLDVMVFTLGLTEVWESRADGAVFPSCPGAIAGEWSPDRYAFRNLTVSEITTDLKQFLERLRMINPAAKVLLTVSPVPLVATATSQHVLPATTYSKSVLRVAAQELADAHDGVDYFPSYEIITGPQAGEYFEADKREVNSSGIEAVMNVFARHYVSGRTDISSVKETAHQPGGQTDRARVAMNVICDELYNGDHLSP